MNLRPFSGLLGVLLAGELYLGLVLEGPSLPLGALGALGLLLAPGIAAGLAQGRTTPGGWLVLAVGSFGLSTLALGLLVSLTGFRLPVVVPALLGLTALGAALGRRGRSEGLPVQPESGTPAWEASPRLYSGPLMPWGPAWPLGLSAALCAALVLGPFGRIGRLGPDGFVFRTFFDHDFLVHLAVVSELGKGLFPPQNPYFGGTELHYYWLYFLYPALAEKLGGAWCSGANTLIFCNFASVIVFSAILFATLLGLAGRPLRALAALGGVLLCGSFEGAYVLERIRQGLPPLHTGDYNVDAVTRWYIAAPQIDTLLRGLLYTHQHLWALGSLLGLGIVLRRRGTRPVGWWVFALLLPLPGLSGFIGAIAVAWLLCLVFLDAAGEPDRRWMGPLAATIGAAGLGWALFGWLGMFRAEGGFVTLLPRPKTWQNLFTLTLLNFGALGLLGLLGAGISFWRRSRLSNALIGLAALVLGLTWYAARDGHFTQPAAAGSGLFLASVAAAGAGVLVALRERHHAGRDHLALGAIGLAAIFSGFIPGYVNEFGLRGGFVVALAAGAFLAMLLRQSADWPRKGRAALGVAGAACVLASLPTPLIDLQNSMNLMDPRFITYLSPREAEALAWIRANVPADALVQGIPDRTQRRGTIGNFINSLGQRRMAVGKTYYAGQFQIGTAAAEARVRQVGRIFREGSLAARLRPLGELGIGYVTVGPDERSAARADPQFFAQHPGIFEPVFDNEELSIYRVRAEGLTQALASADPEPEGPAQ